MRLDGEVIINDVSPILGELATSLSANVGAQLIKRLLQIHFHSLFLGCFGFGDNQAE
jgi:hypothetical protein